MDSMGRWVRRARGGGASHPGGQIDEKCAPYTCGSADSHRIHKRIGTGEAARDLLKGEMRILSKQLDDAGALFLTVFAFTAAAERGIRRRECAAALAGVVAGGELAFSDLEDSLIISEKGACRASFSICALTQCRIQSVSLSVSGWSYMRCSFSIARLMGSKVVKVWYFFFRGPAMKRISVNRFPIHPPTGAKGYRS